MLATKVFLVAIVYLNLLIAQEQILEIDRVKQWIERGNNWPPLWQNESDEFKNAMNQREAEIMKLTAADERWNNWLQFIQPRMVNKFSENGFVIVKTPKHVLDELNEQLNLALDDWQQLPDEQKIDSMKTELPNKLYNMPNAELFLNELKPIHEAFANGTDLEPTAAYGIRIYQNGSTLSMHYDKVASHVISSIIHIGHQFSDNNDQWPLEIEDHDGKIYSINLEPGEMLIYESASCLHGRITPLIGKYYASLYLHYKPKDTSIWNYTTEDLVLNVPPHWNAGIVEEHGSRYAGAALTVDSLLPNDAPARIVHPTLRGTLMYRDVQSITRNLQTSKYLRGLVNK